MGATRLAIVVLAGAAVAAATLGCPPSELGPTCRFRGDDVTACGTCVAAKCRAEVDRCCGDARCQEATMPLVDECSADGRCSSLYTAGSTSTTSTSTLGEVPSCIRQQCSAQCGAADAGITGEIRCERVDQSCRCTTKLDAGTTGSTTTSCGPSDVEGLGDAICCADDGWPGVGTSCLCLPIRCASVRSNPKSCICGIFLLDSELVEESSCTQEEPCCVNANETGCACNGGTCAPGEVERTSCSPRDLAFECEGRKVSSCR